ncbi:hypothetical protein MesoLj131c_65700 (plasmid) [Mesorhizobium sp. 131-3-5]|nr:hypothetical protein MesoLj131c_65700 [Mesorhizobium sp. 131-3-5]
MPPSAGPTLRTALYPTEISVTAAGTSRFRKISPTDACQAGSVNAAPAPARQLKARTIHGLKIPSAARTVSIAEDNAIAHQPANMRLRRL